MGIRKKTLLSTTIFPKLNCCHTILGRELNGESFYLPRNDDGKLTGREIARRYGLNEKTVSSYKGKQSDPRSQLCDSSGRPRNLDEEADCALINWLKGRKIAMNPASLMQTAEKMSELKLFTQQRRSKRTFTEFDTRLCNASVYNVKKRNKITHRVPQTITDARLRALRDIRLHFHQACSVLAFAGTLPDLYKWNSDATGLFVQGDGTGGTVCTVLDKNDPLPVTTSTQPDELGIFIKWMHLCSAAGFSGPLVLIYALKTMPPEMFFHFKVPGLTGETDPIGRFGHVYICETRAGNAAMWKDWLIQVAIPTMKACDDEYKCVDQHNIRQRVFYCSDGEDVILQQSLQPDALEGFRNANIDYLKLAPSATNVHQPNDVATTFRDIKTGLKTMTKKAISCEFSPLRQSLTTAFDHFKATFPSVQLSSPMKEKMIVGAMKVVKVMNQKYFTAEKVQQGFINCGFHVLNSAPGAPTVDYELIMSKCSYTVVPEEIEHMRAVRYQVVDEFLRTGYASTQFLDDLEVARDPSAPTRDENILSKQDCVLITHEDTIEKQAALREQKRVATDPVLIAQRKEQEKSTKEYEKKLKAQQKKRGTAMTALAKKQRYATMSKEAIAAEKRGEKRLKQVEKRKKLREAKRHRDALIATVGEEQMAAFTAQYGTLDDIEVDDEDTSDDNEGDE